MNIVWYMKLSCVELVNVAFHRRLAAIRRHRKSKNLRSTSANNVKPYNHIALFSFTYLCVAMSNTTATPAKTYRIAAGIRVLHTLSATIGTFNIEITDLPWSNTYRTPPDGLSVLKTHHAIFFGAVGSPDVPDHISLWDLRLAICQSLQQYANIRPTRILRGTTSPLVAAAADPSVLD